MHHYSEVSDWIGFFSMKQLFTRPRWPLVLLVTVVVISFVAFWLSLQLWQQQLNTAYLQQLSRNAALLAMHPLREQNAPALSQTLQALQQHSVLPLKALAVYDKNQQIFAATPGAEAVLSSYSPAPNEVQPVTLVDGIQLFSVPIWADLIQSGRHDLPVPAISSEQLGHLLLVAESSGSAPLWLLWPLINLVFLATLLSYWWHKQRQQKRQRQQLLLSQQLQQGLPADISGNEFLPVIEAWQQQQQRVQQQQRSVQRDAEQRLLQQEQLHAHTAENLLQLQQSFQLLQQHSKSSDQQLKFWLELCHRSAQLSAAELRSKIHALQLLSQLHAANFELQPDHVWLPDWLAQHAAQWFADGKIPSQFVFDEDPQAYQFKTNIDPQLLSNLCQIFAAYCHNAAAEQDILFSYRLREVPQKQLKLTFKYAGAGFSARWRQLLLAPPEGALALDDVEAEVARRLLQVLHGSIQLHSLEDLGFQLEILLPLSWQKTSQSKLCQSVLVCDQRTCRLPILKQSLAAIGEQVHSVNALSALPDALQLRLVDLVVLVLPDDKELVQAYAHTINSLEARYQLLCFATDDAALLWQPLLNTQIQPLPLLLNRVSTVLQQMNELGNQQLLVVDDNLTNLKYVQAMLAGGGLRIDIAMTGHEAIAMAAHNRYQLILMDIQLPDLAGTEVTKRIRQLRHHQQTSILAFTAHALPDEIASFRLAGMDDVLIKPLDTHKIAHILARLSPAE